MIVIYTLLGIQILFWIVKYWAILSPFDKEAMSLIIDIDPWFASMKPWRRRKFRYRYNDFLRTTKFIFKDGVPLGEQSRIKKTIALSAARISFRLSRKAFDQY